MQTTKTWQQHYDSGWHPTGAVNSVEEEKEENCVKDPRMIKIVRPITRHTDKLLGAECEIVGDRIRRIEITVTGPSDVKRKKIDSKESKL